MIDFDLFELFVTSIVEYLLSYSTRTNSTHSPILSSIEYNSSSDWGEEEEGEGEERKSHKKK